MTDDRLGICMRMVRVAINDAVLEQVTKTTVTQAFVIPGRQIAAQLIDRKLENQPRRFGRLQPGGNQKGRQYQKTWYGDPVCQPVNSQFVAGLLCNLSRTCSRLKLPGFCRGGYCR